MEYIASYFKEAEEIIRSIPNAAVMAVIDQLVEVRKSGGRLFFLGVGGGAGHASHAVNDFRKIGGFEAYTPSDNVSELTARINDEGWDVSYVQWLRGSRLNCNDGLFVFSVGGGNEEKNISVNLVSCLRYAKEVGARIVGVVGRDGGYTAKVANACIVIPPLNPKTITPQTEAFQAVLWHLMVSHPKIQRNEMKWESVPNK